MIFVATTEFESVKHLLFEENSLRANFDIRTQNGQEIDFIWFSASIT